jgi:3-oxoacyl-[acyl-carrier-protein] synthase-3
MHRAIFGDGAGGILLEPSARGQILSIGLWSDGRYHDKIHVPYPWSKIPASIPQDYNNSFFMSSSQEDFFVTMDFYLAPFCHRLWKEAEVEMDEIDCFLMHQPSMPLYEHSVAALGLPKEKTINYFPRYGNLVAAEVPVYLDEAIQTGRIKPGDLVFALTYGAGFTMGGMVIQC